MKGIKLWFLVAIATGIGTADLFAQSDSLVTYTGTLVSILSGQPVANMDVVYRKLPYESEIGHLTTNSEGKFTAYFRAHEKYSLLIENKGYIKISDIIDPMDGANLDLINERTFRLTIGGVNKVINLEHLKFAKSAADILESSFLELDNLAVMLNESPKLTIRLEGHTDYAGNPTANIKLSQQRVDAVKKYLIDKGANASRIETKAFGGSQPLVRSSASSERSKNRRVEVRIISEGN